MSDIFPDCERNKTVVFSHNDIKGIQMGKFISKSGFSIPEIDSFCRLFINGHLHNGDCYAKSLINLGNVSGQNFSEDGYKYKHCGLILDTSNFGVDWIENPYSLKFFKLEGDRDEIIERIQWLPSNSIISIKANVEDKEIIEPVADGNPNVLTYKFILDIERAEDKKIELSTNSSPLDMFIEFVSKALENSDSVKAEIEELRR